MKLTHKFTHEAFIPREIMIQALPAELYELLVITSREGFHSLVIGGAIRDFVISGKIPGDIDIEIRHPFLHPVEEWVLILKNFARRLRDQYKYQVEELPFSIFRVHLDEMSIEFSSPRLEKYKGDGPFGHSDFDCQLYSMLDFQSSVLRRDFTFNQMAIEHCAIGTEKEFRFIDSLNGLNDLESGVITQCSPQFHCDPVRLLRFVRFSQRFQLLPSESMKAEISRFNLEKLSFFHFKSESIKSKLPEFFNDFFKLAESHQIKISNDVSKMAFLKNSKMPSQKFVSMDSFFVQSLFLESEIWDQQRIDDCVQLFQFKQKWSQEAGLLIKFCKRVKNWETKEVVTFLKSHLLTSLIDQISTHPLLSKLKEGRETLQSEQARLREKFNEQSDAIVADILSKIIQ